MTWTEKLEEVNVKIASRIEMIKEEISVDFVVDISEGFPNEFPRIFNFKYRYKPYTFIAILPQYTDGIPWTDSYNAAIEKIIEIENLQITKEYHWERSGNRINSTTDSFSLEKRKYMEDYEVNEIISVGGFARTYYITHNINDIDYKPLLDGYDKQQDEENGEWINISNMLALKEAVENYTNPKTIIANNLEALKKQFMDSIEPIIRDYADKIEMAMTEYENSFNCNVGDIVETIHGEYHIVQNTNNYFLNTQKLEYKHRVPERFVSFKSEQKITKKDFYDLNFNSKKLKDNGTLCLKNYCFYPKEIKNKLGNIKDFKTPRDIKILIKNEKNYNHISRTSIKK
jgi:hypothetical protein